MKKITYALATLVIGVVSYSLITSNGEEKNEVTQVLTPVTTVKTEKTPIEQKYQFVQERLEYELAFQRDPQTGEIPRDQQILELQNTLEMSRNQNFTRSSDNVYVNRGPSNLGGRTRALVIDISDPTGNTMLAGAVSGGVFRTTNGGQSWTKVSPNSEIHNVTAIAQDPRPGFQNIMYYSTGEAVGNSAALGAGFLGQGIWQSTDGGLNWTQIPETDSTFEAFDSIFDLTFSLEVSPVTGDLFVATINSIVRYDGNTFVTELDNNGVSQFMDVEIDSTGRVYGAIGGNGVNNGVYTSETGDGTWVRIAQNGSPVGWSSVGRLIVASAPSNENFLYAIYSNGANSGANQVEADLWRYDFAADEWTDFSSKMPNEPGGPVAGVDPFSIQGGYDLDIVVRPDNENYVAIAGTSVYRIQDIENDPQFGIIGGYNGSQVALYNTPNGDQHHPDVHSLVFNPFDSNVFFTGTDGGIHRTDDIDDPQVDWVNLNNSYQTYQYYHVDIDPAEGSDFVLGGAQDNGTTIGGTTVGLPDLTEHNMFFGGDGVGVGIGRIGANNPFRLYFGTQLGNFLRFNQLTNNITPIAPQGSNSIFVTYFHLDPDNNNTLYYAGLNRVFRTTDAENVTPTTWDDLGVLAAGERVRRYATTRGDYDPATSYLLIGGDRGNILRLDDPENATNLSEAVNITPPGASTANGTIVSGFAIHPTNPDIVMAVYANYNITNIFLTTNATSDTPTWEVAERNLSAHSIRSAAITEINGQIGYYVGTARGLFSSPDPLGTDWSLEGFNQIGMAVISDLKYRPSDNRLLIGTHGNGMYDTTATTLAVDDITANDAQNNFSVFPNPTSDILNFRITGANSISSFQIIDYTGRILEEGSIDDVSQGNVDVSGYSNGVYFIRAITQNNQEVVSRFIKR